MPTRPLPGIRPVALSSSRATVRSGSRHQARAVARQLATRPPLRRIFWALRQLRSGRPLKATDLAQQFEVHVRTAYRDLDFLRDEWRVPVEFDRAQGTYRLTEPTTTLPPSP